MDDRSVQRGMVALAMATVVTACQPTNDGDVTRRFGPLDLPAQGASIEIDFDFDPAGSSLTRGAVLAEQYADWGVHFENAFVIGDHVTDFPEYPGGNLLCTYEDGVDPQSPGRCSGPQPAAGIPLIADLDFDGCFAIIEGYSRIKSVPPSQNALDNGQFTMQGLDASGAVVTTQQVGTMALPVFTNCTATACTFAPGPSGLSIPNGFPFFNPRQPPPPGPVFRKIVVSESNVGALGPLTITRCAGFVARCVTAQSCAAPGQTVAPSVSIDAGTIDPAGNPVTLSQTPAGPFPVGTTTPVVLTASNGMTTSTCQAGIFGRDCTPPTLTCPAPLTVECTGNPTVVTTPPAVATDDIPGPVTVQGSATGYFTVGTSPIVYQATDSAGNVSQCTTTLAVADTTAPIITVDPQNDVTFAILSPADDQLHAVTLADCGVRLDDTCEGPLPIEGSAHITCVSSDEAEDNHGPDCRDPRHRRGCHEQPDIVVLDDTTVQLRAAMDPHGDGRVYTIAFEAFDTAGNRSTGACKAAVPTDRPRHPPIDSGPHQTVCRR